MATMGCQKSLLFGVGLTGMVAITTIGFVATETAEAVTIKGIAKAQERVSLPSQTLKAVNKRKIKKSPRGNLPILVEEAEDYDFLPDVAVEEGVFVEDFGNARVTAELPSTGDNGITGVPTFIFGDDTNALGLRETGRGVYSIL